ncbi:hypothetical protein EV421DRAFT_1738084 [Armillaria borealis]|uniref:Uncharacterized protein n=1 Tax=Armillaria borealis TaxID=47425 RepID=A0AA39JBS3_9AGAR|nr:hypothetical protein EV421DRAFT_1738084 [Armillaria borealis]
MEIGFPSAAKKYTAIVAIVRGCRRAQVDVNSRESIIADHRSDTALFGTSVASWYRLRKKKEKCMNRSPDILPALKALKISTPGANCYEHMLSFWKERARMPARKMLEHFELTLPMCTKGRAKEFVQRKEVFAIAKWVVLDYQPDMHPPDQDVEMVGDDSDEVGDEETDESEDGGGDMDED